VFWGFKMTDLRARVEHVLKHDIAPALLLDGNGIEVVEVANGIASVRLSGVCSGCPATIMTILTSLEDELRKKVPEVEVLEAIP
jgi:Fe-S cluster biogenesis protein NfuA